MKIKIQPSTALISIFTVIISLAVTSFSETKIVLTWPSAEAELEGILMVPNPQNAAEPLQGAIPGKTANKYVSSSGDSYPDPMITQEIFTIHKPVSGVYQLWVKSKFVEEGFGDAEFFMEDELSVFASSKIKVEIFKDGAKIKTIPVPTTPRGILWLPFEMDGSSGDVTVVNQFYDRLRSIKGKVVNAVNGEPLANTLVLIKNRDSRENVAKAITNDAGEFDQPLDPGRYTIWLGKKDFVSDKFEVDLLYDFPRTIQAVLSPVLIENDLRIVLTWGRYPVDLDAHLQGPDPNGQNFHIYWQRKTKIAGKQFLDRDDTNSFGPETITIRGIAPGIYTYIVHNYSGRNKTSGTDLADGNVQVRIYSGNRMIKQYDLPAGTSGNFWKVFKFDGSTGDIIDINQTGFESNPDAL